MSTDPGQLTKSSVDAILSNSRSTSSSLVCSSSLFFKEKSVLPFVLGFNVL
jgi:hypothetical protein